MTIRDADRFKDKLEVSLDGRQVFFLFFGGAIVACLVFVLGVMTGRRLEGRERVARKALTSAAVDPLAALDELGADEPGAPDDLAFATALAGDEKSRARALGAADIAPPRSLAPDGSGALAQAMRGAAGKLAEPPKADDRPARAELGKTAKAEAGKAEGAKAEGAKAEGAKAEAAKAEAAKAEDDRKFTLQISSFQDRAEADALAGKLSAAGYKPYVVMSDVPEKGIFFRVRIGEFPTRAEALAAKDTFEKKERIIAYVTKI